MVCKGFVPIQAGPQNCFRSTVRETGSVLMNCNEPADIRVHVESAVGHQTTQDRLIRENFAIWPGCSIPTSESTTLGRFCMKFFDFNILFAMSNCMPWISGRRVDDFIDKLQDCTRNAGSDHVTALKCILFAWCSNLKHTVLWQLARNKSETC